MAGKREASSSYRGGNDRRRGQRAHFEEDTPRRRRSYDEGGYGDGRRSRNTGRDDRSRSNGGASRNGRKRRRRRMPVWQKIIITVLTLIILLMILAVALVWAKLGNIDRIGDEYRIDISDESFETVNDGRENTLQDEDVSFTEGDTIEHQDVINILLIGRDSRGTERGRSDSMILVSLNRNTQQISMVSLMRDSYVQIPGYSNNKLNTAFNSGGYDLLNETIEKNYGISIDYNVGVNFDGFEQVVDKLGGIEVELTQAECNYLMDDLYIDSGYLTPGYNLLDGETALCYARARYVSTGSESNDFGRTYRQRVVLTTIYKEMMKLPLTEIWAILDPIMDCIETDMSNTEIISIGTEFYNMGIDDLQSYRLPQDGEYTDEKINGMAVLVLDWEAARQNLQGWLYSETPVAAHGIDAAN